MTEQDTERTRIILASELHLTSLTEQEQAEADEEAAHVLVKEIPPLEAVTETLVAVELKE